MPSAVAFFFFPLRRFLRTDSFVRGLLKRKESLRLLLLQEPCLNAIQRVVSISPLFHHSNFTSALFHDEVGVLTNRLCFSSLQRAERAPYESTRATGTRVSSSSRSCLLRVVSEVFIDPSVFVAPGPGSSSVLAAARPSQHDFITPTSPPILANDALFGYSRPCLYDV